MLLDAVDRELLRLLRLDGRASYAALGAAVGLSASAVLRRVHTLERAGIIRGYAAITAEEETERPLTVIVEITLEHQTDEYLARFEAAVRKSPSIKECYLMSGELDYVLRVEARDAADYERLHREELSRLPGVSRIRSNVAIRAIVRPRVRPLERG